MRGIKNYPPHAVRFWDDGFGPLWIYRDAGGLIAIVRARVWMDAYESVLDEILAPIPPEDVHEAYDFRSNAELDAAVKAGKEPILIEGYEYQPNATGTGIVSIDLNGEYLEPLTKKLVKELGLMFRWE